MFRPDLLQGKRLLVTGGGTGLGFAIARRFIELGASVLICGRREDVLSEASQRLDPGGARCSFGACDVRDADAVNAFVRDQWLRQPLDGLVNCAAGNFVAPTESLSSRAVGAIVRPTLYGTMNMTLACGRLWLAEGRRGTVLSIATTYALSGSPFVVPSAVAKAGVVAMTRSLAVEWGGRGIRLNAVAPGAFPTPGAWERLLPNEALARQFETRSPLGRPGRHDELADLACYLVSDGSAYVNGEVIVMDGGECLQGAAQFSLLGSLGAEDWAAHSRRGRSS